MAKIKEFLHQVKREVILEDDKMYKMLGVKWYGKGAFIREEKLGKEIKAKKAYQVKAGDFIYNRLFAWKSSFAIIRDELDGCYVSNEFPTFEYNSEKININYLLDFILLPKSIHFVNNSSKGVSGVSRNRFKEKIFLNMDIPETTKFEQDQIEVKTGTYRNSLANLENEIEYQQTLIKKLRQLTLQDAISGKLTKKWREKNPTIEPASELLANIKTKRDRLVKEKKIKKQKPLPTIRDDEIPFELPYGWSWCRFQDIADIASKLVSPYDFYDYPHIAPNHIEKNTGKLLEYKTVREDEIISNKQLFHSGQLLYSKVRPQLNKVVLIDFEGLCSADMYPIDAYISPKYLQLVMLSEFFLNEVDKFDNRVKMPKINQNQLNSIMIPVAPKNEQNSIIDKYEKSFSLCRQLEAQSHKSQKEATVLMQAVLKEAFED